jgi:hypothetical protein
VLLAPSRLPKPPQDDQKNNETTKPTIPTISRIAPTVWTLTAPLGHLLPRAGRHPRR